MRTNKNKKTTNNELFLNQTLSIYFRAEMGMPFDKHGFSWDRLGESPDEYTMICLFQWATEQDQHGDARWSSRFVIEDVRIQGLDEQDEIEELVRLEISRDKDVLKEIERLGLDPKAITVNFGDQWTSVLDVKPGRTRIPYHHPSGRRFSIGQCIRMGRVALDMKQSDLSRLIGVSTTMVCLWEKDKSAPSGDFLIKLVEVLDIKDMLFEKEQ